MIKYAVGFLIHNHSEVALIRKARPKWQAGFLNGIGGHIEEGESANSAMSREFSEETGRLVGPWHEFVVVKGKDYELHCFSCHVNHKTQLQCPTDEKPGWYSIDSILRQGKILATLKWLIPMANYKFELRGEIWRDKFHPEC
jgi:8-oxo-dGTP diphosphatase